MKSTPSISAAIILAIALPPAPPTPMTVMRGRSSSTEGGPILMLINRSFQGSLIAGRADCHHSATKRIARAKGKSPYPQYASTCRALLQLSEIRRSEEHTSELQSRENLVCRLLLEKKKIQ